VRGEETGEIEGRDPGPVDPARLPKAGGVRFIPTRRLEGSAHADRLLSAATMVARAFPELKGPVRLDLLPSSSRYRGLTFPGERPPRVALRPHTRTPMALHATIAHEFVHLLQPPHGIVPGGERACDLHALARVGRLFPHPPFYLRLPPGMAVDWPRWAPLAQQLATEALQRRSSGERTYIVAWEQRMKGAYRAWVTGSTPAGRPPDLPER
jgi:hypothetical protein